MKAYLRCYPNGDYVDDYVYAAYQGFDQLGIEIIKFKSEEEIKSIPFSKKNLFVSFVDETIYFLKQNNIKVPDSISMPNVLIPMLSREIRIMSMKEFRAENNCPVFVKPYLSTKLFSAGVLRDDSSKNRLPELIEVSDDELVLTSTIVDFISEYRVFINNKKIVGCQNYIGDPFKMIDKKYVDECLMLMNETNAPIAYTLDFGVMNNGKTEFIEANDAWSIGHYGLSPKLYAKMLINRWLEIVN